MYMRKGRRRERQVKELPWGGGNEEGRTSKQVSIHIDVMPVLDGRRVVVEVIFCHACWSLCKRATVRFVTSAAPGGSCGVA